MKTAAPRAPASATMGASIGACDALVDAQETAGHYGVQSTTCLLPFSWAGGLHVTGLSCVSSFPRDSWRRGSSVRSAPSPPPPLLSLRRQRDGEPRHRGEAVRAVVLRGRRGEGHLARGLHRVQAEVRPVPAALAGALAEEALPQGPVPDRRAPRLLDHAQGAQQRQEGDGRADREARLRDHPPSHGPEPGPGLRGGGGQLRAAGGLHPRGRWRRGAPPGVRRLAAAASELGDLPHRDGLARVGLPQHQDDRRVPRRRDHERREGAPSPSAAPDAADANLRRAAQFSGRRASARVCAPPLRAPLCLPPRAVAQPSLSPSPLRVRRTATLSRRRTSSSASRSPTAKRSRRLVRFCDRGRTTVLGGCRRRRRARSARARWSHSIKMAVFL